MIVHIVSWKLKQENKLQNALTIKRLLESLIAEIPGIRTLHTGINSPEAPADNWDVVLYSEFNSIEDLNAYQQHPKHKEVGLFIKSAVENRVCVDYEV
jgi:hypothetical protein